MFQLYTNKDSGDERFKDFNYSASCKAYMLHTFSAMIITMLKGDSSSLNEMEADHVLAHSIVLFYHMIFLAEQNKIPMMLPIKDLHKGLDDDAQLVSGIIDRLMQNPEYKEYLQNMVLNSLAAIATIKITGEWEQYTEDEKKELGKSYVIDREHQLLDLRRILDFLKTPDVPEVSESSSEKTA